MWAAQSRGFPVNPVMTQDEAHQRLRALIESLPEDEQRRLQELERRDDGPEADVDPRRLRH
jgi:hypothetical protein